MGWAATFATLNLNKAQVKTILDDVGRRRHTMLNVLRQTPIGQQIFDEGIEQGKAQSVLAILAARGVPVSEEAQARIRACGDLRRLDRWLIRAMSAASADEVLAAD